MNIIRSHKKGVVLLGLLAVLALLVPHFAHGAGWLDSLANPAGFWVWPIQLIGYALYSILGLVFQFGGWLVGIALKLNMNVMKDPLVTIGWTISRDIANLGFVLVMIIVAFATIVNSAQYGYKKLLANLIIAAIIVNFSLAIAGVFIDFSHVLTNFFLSKVSTQTYTGLPEKLAAAMKPQSLIMGDLSNPLPPDPSQQTGALSDFGQAALQPILEMGFIVAFTGVAAIVLITIAVMFIVRYVYLAFLLLVAPLAWLFWVLPGYAGTFDSWWKKFMQQVLFAPAATFTLYLALAASEKLAQMDTGSFFKVGALQNIIQQGARMVILTGIVMGGLILANSMGIMGAKEGLDRIKGFGMIAKNYASGRARDLGKRVTETKAGQFLSRNVGLRFGTGIRKLAEYKPTTRAGKVAQVLTTPLRAPAQAILGVAGQGLQTVVGGAPAKPDSLGSLAWGAITGGTKGVQGQYDKAKKAKEERSLEEMEKDHAKKLARREELKNAGVSVADITKDIEKLEGEMAKKSELPVDEESLEKAVKDIRLKRDQLLAKALDPSFFDKQLAKAKVALDKARGTEAEISPARKVWETHASTLATRRDADIRSGTYKPSIEKPHPSDAAIETAEAQAKSWQRLEKQKPKTRAQWQERATQLESAHETAKNTFGESHEVVGKIKDLLDDAKREATKAEGSEKAPKAPKPAPASAPTGPAPTSTPAPASRIVTTGFTETTPIAEIRAQAAAQSREEERARRAEESARKEPPKIIT